MDIKELRGYGLPLNECMRTIAPELSAELRRTADDQLAARVGASRMELVRQEAARQRLALAAVELSSVRARGLEDDSFLESMAERAAKFLALVRVVGREEAAHTWMAVMAGSPSCITPRGMAAFLPTAADFSRCGDAFAAFRLYMIAQMKACSQAGLLQSEVLRDSPSRLEFRITWCAFAEILRLMGAPEAARSSCRADEMVYPELGRSIGFSFRERTRTIADGASCCDLCFEACSPTEVVP